MEIPLLSGETSIKSSNSLSIKLMTESIESESYLHRSPTITERLRAFQITTKIVAMTALSPRHPDVQEARKEMSNLWARYIEYLRNKWIQVQLEGFENVDWENIHLVLGNHQAFWLEAHIIHHLVPDATVMMKDGLLRTPWIGPVIARTGPLIFNRSENPKTALRKTQEQQEKILQAGGRLVVFPEWTRLKDSRKNMLPWSPLLYSKALDIVLARWEHVAIITTDSMWVISCTMEEALMLRGWAKPWTIRIKANIVTIDWTIKAFNKKAMDVIMENLRRESI